MKAMAIQQFGGAEELTLTELPDPKVGPNEVLIRVKAAGVNPVDWKLGAGYMDTLFESHFPIVLGWDVAGVVESVGFDAAGYSVGDEVFGFIRKDQLGYGAYAELVSANVRMITHKPVGLSWEEAAGIPLVGLTARQAIELARVRSGDTVLVHAASGAVGSLATQIAVAAGARVIGTAGPRNHDYLRSLGAEPVTYGDGLVERLKALAPEGVDAVLDLIGGGTAETTLHLLKDVDRLVSIADFGADALGGHFFFVRPDSAALASLGALLSNGKLSLRVDRVLPLAEVGTAWEASRNGESHGKTVLTVG